MKLIIDGKDADIDTFSDISISVSSDALIGIDNKSFGETIQIKIPVSETNIKIIGSTDQINAVDDFNEKAHYAKIEKEGSVVAEGELRLAGCEKDSFGNGYFLMAILSQRNNVWVKRLSQKKINDVEIEFNERMNGDIITESWTWNKPVRFLPVIREVLEQSGNNENNTEVQKKLSITGVGNYHPFVNVRDVFKAIFNQAGYRVKSTFIDSELFNSLYASGNITVPKVYPVKSNMNFKAGRHTSVSAVTNHFGRVYADPNTSLNSVGNIVETTDPVDVNSDEKIPGLFNTNDCFRKIGDRIAFVPTKEIEVGFEYNIFYKTSYEIKNSRELNCVNIINIGTESDFVFNATNPFVDRKNDFRGDKTYRIINFDYNPNDQYQFRYDMFSSTSASAIYKSRLAIIAPGTVSNPQIWVKKNGTYSYVLFTGEWVIYDGYVAESGEINLEVTIKSKAEKVAPDKPKFFDNIYFAGEPGMNFTLNKGTTLKPVFSAASVENVELDYKGIMSHNISQLQFVSAISHMFNLRFYTDRLTNEVIIEPWDNFFDDSTIIDWSEKVDAKKRIEIYEQYHGIPNAVTYSYKAGDIAVEKWNEQNQDEFGVYRHNVDRRLAEGAEKVITNPFFAPSLTLSNVCSDAPDAAMIEGVNSRNKSDNLNFQPKIVMYAGMTTLPEGQLWGWPSFSPNYPLAAFHYMPNNDPNILQLFRNGTSLCFEDRDDVKGLNLYHNKYDSIFYTNKRVTLHLYLNSEDIEKILSPSPYKSDIRALYKLKIDGEYCYCYLLAIDGYKPASGESVKCLFIKRD